VFRAWFGFIPGGTAVVCAFLCSFFTVFTGGSGVTILALGGVLFPALLRDGYRERFSLGLMTAAGSLGLLLPPALPLILYGVVAQIPIEDLFIGGILPGILLTTMIAAWGVREGIITGAGRQPFRWREAFVSLWAAKWELAMPLVVLVAMFSGLATAVEASALVALYALLVQTVVHRDLSVRRDLLRVFSLFAIAYIHSRVVESSAPLQGNGNGDLVASDQASILRSSDLVHRDPIWPSLCVSN